jgi:ABC-type multidrug transport system fused ATPase/permease subunit
MLLWPVISACQHFCNNPCLIFILTSTAAAALPAHHLTAPLQMLVFYTWSVRFTADAISMMSSTEKVGWLATKTPLEGDALYNADGPTKDADSAKQIVKVAAGENGGAPDGWPRRGNIEFDNVWMKYLPSAPYALKGE